MTRPLVLVAASIMFSASLGCSSDDEPSNSDPVSSVVWDESVTSQGELSGDLTSPTAIMLSVGDNVIIGTSVPGATQTCIDNPDGSKTPYFPEHASYTDAFAFTLPADQKLTRISVETLDVEAVHDACGFPMEEQLGAFTGIANSDQIDWNSDTFEDFVKLPTAHPLVGAGFAKAVGDDLLAKYKAGFSFGPFSIDPLAADPTNGTYTFWWKEGANNVSYQLNLVVESN